MLHKCYIYSKDNFDDKLCDKCEYNMNIQRDMMNADTFDKLLSIHLDWINGRRS